MMINDFLILLAGSVVIKLLIMAEVLDTILGILRAIKYKCLNSSFGIDGAIRKIAMIVCSIVLMLVDCLVNLNLINLLPDGSAAVLGIEKVGVCEFFSILFIIYECISILKNMYLDGLPVPAKVKDALEKLLTEMTDEMSTVNEYENSKKEG